MRNLLIILTILCSPTLAFAVDCSNWSRNDQFDSIDFFERASVQDVKNCLSQGYDVMARSYDGKITPLHNAALGSRNPDVIELLIRKGADVNARSGEDGFTPLHWAAMINNNPAVAQMLIDKGADVMAELSNGYTPLHLAAANPNPEVIQLLIRNGAR